MAQHPSGDKYSTREIVAGIGTYGAAAVLLVSAVATILLGISTLAHDRTIVAGPGYSYEFSTTAWGWIHLLAPGSGTEFFLVSRSPLGLF